MKTAICANVLWRKCIGENRIMSIVVVEEVIDIKQINRIINIPPEIVATISLETAWLAKALNDVNSYVTR